MRAIQKYVLVWVVAVLITMAANVKAEAARPDNKETELKAAFVRKGDLWVKNGHIEKRLVQGPSIGNPKWSFDGQWLAYTSGENEEELWVLQVQTRKSIRIAPKSDKNFQWSPTENRLAFQTDQQLYWSSVQDPEKPAKVAEGIGNFSWLPDGNGFVASTEAKLLPDGWTPVAIVKISAVAGPGRIETLYVLPKQSDDFFAVATSVFKWSADGRWIAFIAKPTASLSADSNTLCVLSADGKVFKTLDQMVSNEQWFQWADQGDILAYIGGIGREAITNKQLKVIEIPAGKPVTYTPSGYVDQGFTWQGLGRIVASRAKESEESAESGKRPFPSLIEIRLENGQEHRLTSPSNRHGDYQPQSLHSKQLVWVQSNRRTANVMVYDPNWSHTSLWITNIDLGTNYNEQWHWSSVLNIYDPK